MKKRISILMTMLMFAIGLSACGSGTGNTDPTAGSTASGTAGEKKLSIVTTIFPEYDWVRSILGDRAKDVELTMLLDNGADLHSYQPTANDILKLSACDVFIYVGGESDEWVKDALKEATNKDMVVIDLLDVMGDKAKTEEVVEGMEHDHDHEEADHDHEDADHDHEDAEHEEADHDHEDADHDHDHEEELDEHVWLSLKNAKLLTGAITEGLAKADPANAELYRTNLKAYTEKLDALDQKYKETVDAASVKTVLFGDRFPFRYMTDDYGLTYFAAFTGCSAESEASFETIVFLSNKTEELGLPAILTIEGKEHKIAETIRDTTKSRDQKILTLNSMQSVTSKDVEDGASYLSIMESNLEVLNDALNR